MVRNFKNQNAKKKQLNVNTFFKFHFSAWQVMDAVGEYMQVYLFMSVSQLYIYIFICQLVCLPVFISFMKTSCLQC